MLAAVGLAQPRAGWIDAVLVFEHAFQDQNFFATGAGSCLTFAPGSNFTNRTVSSLNSWIAMVLSSGLPLGAYSPVFGLDRELAVVTRLELAQFHEDRAAVFTEW